jgi:hypothetical protein
MNCPRCGSARTVKNGQIHNGKAKRMCTDCRIGAIWLFVHHYNASLGQ